MKVIELTSGKTCIVDDDDYEELSKHKWCFKAGGPGYAVRNIRLNGKGRLLVMHREIMKVPDGKKTDHINGNGLDNRKCNLRICSHAENLKNRSKQSNNTSGYKGVYKLNDCNRWGVAIGCDGKETWVGSFKTKEEAALAYNEAALRVHGKFARLNTVRMNGE